MASIPRCVEATSLRATFGSWLWDQDLFDVFADFFGEKGKTKGQWKDVSIYIYHFTCLMNRPTQLAVIHRETGEGCT